MTWPPQQGQLWLTTERWPQTMFDHEIPGGSMVLILGGEARLDPITRTRWWSGTVLVNDHARWIKATEDDIIPADDPRIHAFIP